MWLRLSGPYFSTVGQKLSPTDNFASLLRRSHELYCSCKVSGCQRKLAGCWQQDEGSVCLAKSRSVDIHIYVDIVVDIDAANANLNALATYLEDDGGIRGVDLRLVRCNRRWWLSIENRRLLQRLEQMSKRPCYSYGDSKGGIRHISGGTTR